MNAVGDVETINHIAGKMQDKVSTPNSNYAMNDKQVNMSVRSRLKLMD